MKVAFVLFLASMTYGADYAAMRMTTTFGGKSPGIQRDASADRKITVFPGDDALPQLVSGGGWTTQIILVNLSAFRLPFLIDFWRSDGSYWQLSIDGLGTGDQIAGALDPGATAILETTGQGGLAQGWAELTYDTSLGRIGGLGIFRQTVAGRPDFEAAVPLSSLFDNVIVLPYDNSSGYTTGVAAVNGARDASATITATFRDENGIAYATESITLQRSGHTAFELPLKYPATRGRRGTVLFRSNTDFFSVLGLRFNPGGSFTSFSGVNSTAMLEVSAGQ